MKMIMLCSPIKHLSYVCLSIGGTGYYFKNMSEILFRFKVKLSHLHLPMV